MLVAVVVLEGVGVIVSYGVTEGVVVEVDVTTGTGPLDTILNPKSDKGVAGLSIII